MLEQRKLALLTGIHANSNIGGNDLQKAVTSLEEHFDMAKRSLYSDKKEDEVDQENPFFKNIKIPELDAPPAQKLLGKIADMEPEIDQ